MNIKQVLQQQILASIALSDRSLAVSDWLNSAEIAPETIPLHRLSDDRDVLYRSAIALKLAPLWQIPALNLAHQLADTMAKLNQEVPQIGTQDWERQRGKVGEGENPTTQIQYYQQTITPLPSHPLISNASSPAWLDLSIEVSFPGWILCRLSDHAVATWLQRLIQIPPLLSDLPNDLAIGFQQNGVAGEGERTNKNESIEKLDTADQEQLAKRTKTTRQLFEVQYTHARCCSLLRLAHRQGLIELSDPDCKTPSWHFVEPNPIPWLDTEQERESEMCLRLAHPSERALFEQILDGVDQISQLNSSRALKLATTLSNRFERFYSACRIWGEVKSETPKLAQARLGLVGVTQKLLRSLLENQLAVTAPTEL